MIETISTSGHQSLSYWTTQYTIEVKYDQASSYETRKYQTTQQTRVRTLKAMKTLLDTQKDLFPRETVDLMKPSSCKEFGL